MNKIVVFGFKDSLVGQVVNFIKNTTNYEIQYFITPNDFPQIELEYEHARRPNKKTEFIENNQIFGKKIFSEKNYIAQLKMDGINKVLVLEENTILRSEIFRALKAANIKIITYIHPTVFMAGDNSIGEGAIIFPQCYIGYKSDIGDGTIIQSNCTIDHHNVIGKFADINQNLTTGGFTYIGDFTEINISVDIINHIRIENYSRIGAGSLVIKNCESNSLYFGRPAKFQKKIN